MAEMKFAGDKSEEAEAIRQALKPTRTERPRVPKWVLLAVKAAIKGGKLKSKPASPLRSPRDALQYARHALGGSWVDHVGTLKEGGREVLVAEPYAANVNSEAIQELERFCDVLGADYRLSNNSDHAPGKTLRILITQREAESADS